MIVTSYYSNRFKAPGQAALKIAVVSDLHDRNPRKALELLSREKPDLILVPGDLMERHQEGEITSEGVPSELTEEDIIHFEGKKQRSFIRVLIKILDGSYEGRTTKHTEKANCNKKAPRKAKKAPEERCGNLRYDRKNGYYFLQKASRIAPIFYSSGNHEWYHTPKDMAAFRKYHINFVDNTAVNIQIKGVNLLIGGLPTRYDDTWLHDFAHQEVGPDTRKILLMHHPEYYDRCVAGQDTFDLIVSGHAHGGHFRFFGHGIYAPGQGFLPRYHHGIYPQAHGLFLVSAGASNTNNIPRLGNPTEIVILQEERIEA